MEANDSVYWEMLETHTFSLKMLCFIGKCWRRIILLGNAKDALFYPFPNKTKHL